jgi:cobalt-zinc-cadmium efflux system protein
VPPERVAAAIKARLKEAFGVVHATVEVEHRDCADDVPARSCGKV